MEREVTLMEMLEAREARVRQQDIRRILEEHFAAADREQVSALVTRALLDEVCTTPKPGLVDRANNGSHKDMDIFIATAETVSLFAFL